MIKKLYQGNFHQKMHLNYKAWKRSEEEVAGGESKSSSLEIMFLKKAYTECLKNDSILRKAMGKEKYTGKELGDYLPTDATTKKAKTSFYGLDVG